MHLFEMPEPFRSALLRMAMPSITPIVQLTAYTKTVITYDSYGSPVFTTGYPLTVWNDVNRLASTMLDITVTKPVLPADGREENSIRTSEVTLQFVNTDGYFSVTDVRGIFDPERIEQSEVVILAQIGDDPALRWPVYRGRIIGLPQEEFGLSTFSVRDELWKPMREPVLFEKFSPSQQTYVTPLGTLVNGTHTIGSGSSTLQFYDATVIFAEEGSPLTSFSNSKPDDIDLRRVGVGNKALPGKYTIEFMDAINYRVIYPDNQVLTGVVVSNYPPPSVTEHSISIPYSAWSITGDPTDAKIEFYVSYVVRGNPVQAIMNLLEKGFTDGWGAPATMDPSLPIDWPSFTAVRDYFSAWEVSIDATNQDNKVWMKKRGNKPLSCLQLAQQIADHIACQIVIDPTGFIRLSHPGLFPETLHPISDTGSAPAIVAPATVEAQTRFNWIKLNYGFDSLAGSFSSHILFDERVSADDEKVEYSMNFHFYKQTRNVTEMASIGRIYLQRFLRSFTLITIKLAPNWALPMMPGDRFRLMTSTSPVLDLFVEAVSIGKTIGGECVVKVVKVGAPSQSNSVVCEMRVCETPIC